MNQAGHMCRSRAGKLFTVWLLKKGGQARRGSDTTGLMPRYGRVTEKGLDVAENQRMPPGRDGGLSPGKGTYPQFAGTCPQGHKGLEGRYTIGRNLGEGKRRE